MHVNATIALPRDGAPDVITDSQGPMSLALAFAQRGQGINRFAALADGEDKGVLVHRHVAVPEFAGEFAFRRQVRQALDKVFARQSRMKRGSASRQHDSLNVS